MDKIKILIVEDDISEAIRLETGLSELGSELSKNAKLLYYNRKL